MNTNIKRIDQVCEYLLTIYKPMDVKPSYGIGVIFFGEYKNDWSYVISFWSDGRIMITHDEAWTLNSDESIYTCYEVQDMINFLKILLVQDL